MTRPPELLSDPTVFAAAPCVGEWSVMDEGGPAAEAVCDRCPTPTFRACASVLDTIPGRARTGTWAGHTFGARHQET